MLFYVIVLNDAIFYLDDEAEAEYPDDESPEKPTKKKRSSRGKKKKDKEEVEEETGAEEEEGEGAGLQAHDIDEQYQMFPPGLPLL